MFFSPKKGLISDQLLSVYQISIVNFKFIFDLQYEKGSTSVYSKKTQIPTWSDFPKTINTPDSTYSMTSTVLPWLEVFMECMPMLNL